MPLPYRYEALIAGEIFYIFAMFTSWRNTVYKSKEKEK
jgi:hypothetical protein